MTFEEHFKEKARTKHNRKTATFQMNKCGALSKQIEYSKKVKNNYQELIRANEHNDAPIEKYYPESREKKLKRLYGEKAKTIEGNRRDLSRKDLETIIRLLKDGKPAIEISWIYGYTTKVIYNLSTDLKRGINPLIGGVKTTELFKKYGEKAPELPIKRTCDLKNRDEIEAMINEGKTNKEITWVTGVPFSILKNIKYK